jgi:hypothetical protein
MQTVHVEMLDLCMFGEGSFDKEILTIVGDEGKDRIIPAITGTTCFTS